MADLQTYRIEVFARTTNTRNKWVETAHQLHIDSLTGCFNARIFFLRGSLNSSEIERLAKELLADPVTEEYFIGIAPKGEADHSLDVCLQVGVTDPEAESLLRAAANMGIPLEQAATGQTYKLFGKVSPDELEQLGSKVFANTVIQPPTDSRRLSCRS